ncbi:sensor histidine kinase [Paenibacillus tarimensis]|uniref:sensor histidine kinase n=1 Tax=Paenibacillus tarimensis TaxID=416012 RepID=UPI001F18F50B|nr:histidine kinase [Paenibacillus tarimensis]MCF2942920.1 histidine kinase [Paenibacillus tarimensis]
MTYKQIKYLILWTPTVTIGVWEYLRHTVLLPYISMELGNLLAPVLVLLVTVTLLRKLFTILEETQEALHRERLTKAGLEEREQLARELHDGISQSLFLMSVKLDKLERAESDEDLKQVSEQIRSTVRRVYEDVRQSIANLQHPPAAVNSSWQQTIEAVIAEALNGSGLKADLDWRIPDHLLTSREKVELVAIVREALLNARKHAEADTVCISCEPLGFKGGFRCMVADDGKGTEMQRLHSAGCFGIRMMESRAAEMGWSFEVKTSQNEAAAAGGTVVTIVKRGDEGADDGREEREERYVQSADR